MADLYSLATPKFSREDVVEKRNVIDLTGKMQSDGTLDWTPPPGGLGRDALWLFASRHMQSPTRISRYSSHTGSSRMAIYISWIIEARVRQALTEYSELQAKLPSSGTPKQVIRLRLHSRLQTDGQPYPFTLNRGDLSS